MLPLILTEMNPTRCHHSIPLKIQLSVDTDIEKVPPVEFKEICPTPVQFMPQTSSDSSVHLLLSKRERNTFLFLFHIQRIIPSFCDETKKPTQNNCHMAGNTVSVSGNTQTQKKKKKNPLTQITADHWAVKQTLCNGFYLRLIYFLTFTSVDIKLCNGTTSDSDKAKCG